MPQPTTYAAANARYLIVLTPRLDALINELQAKKDRSRHSTIYRVHQPELVERIG